MFNRDYIVGLSVSLSLVITASLLALTYTPNPPAAHEAAKWLKQHADERTFCAELETEWEKNKQVVEVFGCKLHGETREIVSCEKDF